MKILDRVAKAKQHFLEKTNNGQKIFYRRMFFFIVLGSLFEPLCNTGEGDGKCLNGAKWSAKVERIGAVLDPTELHHLKSRAIRIY